MPDNYIKDVKGVNNRNGRGRVDCHAASNTWGRVGCGSRTGLRRDIMSPNVRNHLYLTNTRQERSGQPFTLHYLIRKTGNKHVTTPVSLKVHLTDRATWGPLRVRRCRSNVDDDGNSQARLVFKVSGKMQKVSMFWVTCWSVLKVDHYLKVGIHTSAPVHYMSPVN